MQRGKTLDGRLLLIRQQPPHHFSEVDLLQFGRRGGPAGIQREPLAHTGHEGLGADVGQEHVGMPLGHGGYAALLPLNVGIEVEHAQGFLARRLAHHRHHSLALQIVYRLRVDDQRPYPKLPLCVDAALPRVPRDAVAPLGNVGQGLGRQWRGKEYALVHRGHGQQWARRQLVGIVNHDRVAGGQLVAGVSGSHGYSLGIGRSDERTRGIRVGLRVVFGNMRHAPVLFGHEGDAAPASRRAPAPHVAQK